MAIIAYVGLQGSGKSYGVMENVLIPFLKKNRKIYTNIPLNNDLIKQKFGYVPEPFTIQEILDNDNWFQDVFEKGSIFICDEVWQLWPAGLTAKQMKEGHKTFITMHRHDVNEEGFSTEIFLVTQDLATIATFVRNLVESTFRSEKLLKLGLNKRFRVDIYSGPVSGPNPPSKRKIREIQSSYKKSVYQLYVSHTNSVTGQAGQENKDVRFNVLRGFSFKAGVVVILLGAVIAYKGISVLSEYYQQPNGSKGHSEPLSSSAHSNDLPSSLEPKKPVFEFLSKSTDIYINFNNGHFPLIDYKFYIEFNENYVNLSITELRKLGYKVQPINDCMTLITGDDFNSYALCKSSKERKNLIENLISSN